MSRCYAHKECRALARKDARRRRQDVAQQVENVKANGLTTIALPTVTVTAVLADLEDSQRTVDRILDVVDKWQSVIDYVPRDDGYPSLIDDLRTAVEDV